MYRFSTERFKESAPKGIQKQIGDHVDVLNGVEVIFDGRYGEYGHIPQYFVNGQGFHLYPVYKCWCKEEID